MKCPNCGADIGNSKECQFCGSKISYEMLKEQEQLNKKGCPKCNSTNIKYNREKQAEVKNKKSKRIIYKTVGCCSDCGYTWFPTPNNTNSNNNIIWWVLGWLCFFPAPVMVLVWRSKKTTKKFKILFTAVFWAAIILFYIFMFTYSALTSPSSSTEGTSLNETTTINVSYGENAEEDVDDEYENIYEYDKGINKYINNYNLANPERKITEDMAQPYHHHGTDHKDQIKFTEDGIDVVITGGAKVVLSNHSYNSASYSDFRNAFTRYLKGFNLGLTDEEINDDWNTLTNDSMNSYKCEKYSATVRKPTGNIELIEIIKQ